jgi:hypothetical protein
LVFVHENEASRRHYEDYAAANDTGEQVGPENNLVQQLHR